MYMQNIHITKLMTLRVTQIGGQECQIHHCQHKSINIGVKFKTEKLALVMILSDVWGIGYLGRCLVLPHCQL